MTQPPAEVFVLILALYEILDFIESVSLSGWDKDLDQSSCRVEYTQYSDATQFIDKFEGEPMVV